MKFVRKQHCLNAEQWFPGESIEGYDIVKPEYTIVDSFREIDKEAVWVYLKTRHNDTEKALLEPGDWVATDQHGEQFVFITEQLYDEYETVPD